MAVTQYIGARYVPLFADPVEWTSTKQYEPLTIVMHEGNSYTSKQFVPVGVDISDSDFWVLTGNYNAQVEQYRLEVARAQESLTAQTKVRALSFDTASDMKASDKLYVGAVCHTNGFHESSDGGAAWYIITDSGEANDMNVLECGTLFGVYIPDSTINIESLNVPESGNIDSVIDIAQSYNRPICFKENKTYYITKQVTISTDWIGNNCTIQTSFDKRCFLTSDYVVVDRINFRGVINNPREQYPFDSDTLNACILVENTNVKITGCTFNYFASSGIAIIGTAARIRIEDCDFNTCGIGFGIECTPLYDQNAPYNVTVSNCKSKCNYSCAVGSGTYIIDSCTFITDQPEGRACYCIVNDTSQNTKQHFTNCVFKSETPLISGGNAILILSKSPTQTDVITETIFDCCSIYSNRQDSISARNANKITFNSCYIESGITAIAEENKPSSIIIENSIIKPPLSRGIMIRGANLIMHNNSIYAQNNFDIIYTDTKCICVGNTIDATNYFIYQITTSLAHVLINNTINSGNLVNLSFANSGSIITIGNSTTTFDKCGIVSMNETQLAAYNTTGLKVGTCVFLTNVGKPVFWSGSNWHYADGTLHEG